MRKTSIVEALITDFQQVEVVFKDISAPRLIILFIEGFIKPLRGWVKS